MDLDQKTAKLIALFLSMNLVAAALGFAAVVLFGAVAGLTVFAILILVLPIGLQYVYLKRSSEK